MKVLSVVFLFVAPFLIAGAAASELSRRKNCPPGQDCYGVQASELSSRKNCPPGQDCYGLQGSELSKRKHCPPGQDCWGLKARAVADDVEPRRSSGVIVPNCSNGPC